MARLGTTLQVVFSLTLLVLYLGSWPGAVSGDMASVVLEAMTGNIGGHFEPMFTFLWWCALQLVPVPVAVVVLYTAIMAGYWAVFAGLVHKATAAGAWGSALVVFAMGVSPPMLCFCTSIESNVVNGISWGLAVVASSIAARPRVLWLVVPLLYLGSIARYGTFVYIVPVTWACMRLSLPHASRKRVVVLGLVAAASMLTLSYSIKRMVLGNPANTSVVSVSKLFDIAGVMERTGRSHFPDFVVPPPASVHDVMKSYRPHDGAVLIWNAPGVPTFRLPMSVEQAEELHDAWLRTLWLEFPFYMQVKLRFLKSFLLWDHDTAYGSGPDYSGNRYVRVASPEDVAFTPLARYGRWFHHSVVWKGWIWILLGFVVAVATHVFATRSRRPVAAVVLGAWGALLPHFLLGQSVLCRYFFPAFLLTCVAVGVGSTEIWVSARRTRTHDRDRAEDRSLSFG